MKCMNGREEVQKEGLEWAVTHYGKIWGKGYFLVRLEGRSDGKLYKLGYIGKLNCLSDYFVILCASYLWELENVEEEPTCSQAQIFRV